MEEFSRRSRWAKYRGSVCVAKEVHSILIQLTQMAPEERSQERFHRECDHCSKLNHPANIVRFIGICHPPQQLFPVMTISISTAGIQKLLKEVDTKNLDLITSRASQLGS